MGVLAAFSVLAINPFGGMMIAIPFAVFKLGWHWWLAVILGVPLSFVQVVAVELLWEILAKMPWWHRFLEKRRSQRLERLVDSRGAFWLTVLFSPVIGPWLVMAFMRYAKVPFRRVALPLFLGLCWNGVAIALCCELVPRLFYKVRGY